jgi:L-methionine (R)-S-oxide reductase
MSHGEAYACVKGRVPEAGEKTLLYQEAAGQLAALLDGETDPGVVMSSIVAVLHHTMPHYFWTGFYRVAGDELCVGPYQGTPACLRIPRGRGVCGTAWAQEAPLVVEDVHAFPGHIACDARSASEIVIPWKDHEGVVVAVLDVDSTLPAAFDTCDRENLMRLCDNHRLGRGA